VRVNQETFGITQTGIKVDKFTLVNAANMQVELINYGSRITSIRVPDAEGCIENVVLGFDDLESYEADKAFIGALVGRYANRISGARFKLDGQEYLLNPNEGDNHLHGGVSGLHNRVWQASPFHLEDSVGVELFVQLEDGLEGYPGNLVVQVRITLTNSNELVFDYRAKTDKPTVVNLTHHGYFNLAGRSSGSCMNHLLQIAADAYTPVDSDSLPTGELRPVANSPFDFQKLKHLGQDSGTPVGEPEGFDHNFVLQGVQGEMRDIAQLVEPNSQRAMSVSTTEPGVQLYTGQYLDCASVDGQLSYGPSAGLCLECQHFPDSPNIAHFPNTELHPAETYRQTTTYSFTLI
jgi:aldose 1-epimerase